LGESVLHLVLTSMIMEMYPELGMDTMNVSTLAVCSLQRFLNWSRASAKISSKIRLCLNCGLMPNQRSAVYISLLARYTKQDIGALHNDQGFQVTTNRLDGILRPLVSAIYDSLPDHAPPPPEKAVGLDSPPSSPQHESQAGSYIASFNEQLQKSQRRAEWTYTEGIGPAGGKERDPGVPGNKINGMWCAEVVVDGVTLGRGEGSTKKAARNECAREALERMGGMS
ncbi:hypothetical protein FB45DRAFT_755861, partial [Roridomyces roridus]